MQRKYLRKGGMVIFNGVHMAVEEFLALGEDPLEDVDTKPLEEEKTSD